MSEVIIGTSGFKYTETTSTKRRYSFIQSRTCIVKDIKTDKTIFTLTGNRGILDYTGKRNKKIDTKRFLGLDNRYYYIEVSHEKIIWGQIQSSGAVIAKDRTIIKQLDFFPMNIETPTVPIVAAVPTAITVIPTTTKIPDTSPVIKDKPAIEELVEIKWLKRTIKTIQKQIILLIQKIMSLLQSPKM